MWKWILTCRTSLTQRSLRAKHSGRRLTVGWFMKQWYRVRHPALATRVFGLDFENPVGLAAGFDKHVRLMNLMPALGFGFMEIGTITGQAQPGNPRPRLFRLPQEKALINRMGFNNVGSSAAATRLAKRPHDLIIGANIGRTKIVANEHALEDYAQSFNALAPHADFVVINVSSPNTPGLRQLQDRGPLLELLMHLQKLNGLLPTRRPLLLKIAPDLTNDQLDDVVAMCTMAHIDGIIATNTTIAREKLTTPQSRVEQLGAGGLSGKPVRNRATEVVRYLYHKTNGTLPIIGVGGIFSGEDAYEKIRAGASLVEVYTGMIYEGPGIVRRINKGLIKLLARDGFKSIKEAIGTQA